MASYSSNARPQSFSNTVVLQSHVIGERVPTQLEFSEPEENVDSSGRHPAALQLRSVPIVVPSVLLPGDGGKELYQTSEPFIHRASGIL
jgi:hypothetical protein